jgi:putative NIF3 family GTP cyclohydrolase 1 type 2
VQNAPPGFEQAGYGRILEFDEPQELRTLIRRAGDNLRIDNMAGHLKGLSVATPQSIPAGSKGDIKISTVGICAGSGGSLLNGLNVDLLFTGELSHHEALAATEQGRSVITVFHSNSERGFLHLQMKDLLTEQVEKEIAWMVSDGQWYEGFNKSFEIGVSAVDRDPYEIKMLDDLEEW